MVSGDKSSAAEEHKKRIAVATSLTTRAHVYRRVISSGDTYVPWYRAAVHRVASTLPHRKPSTLERGTYVICTCVEYNHV